MIDHNARVYIKFSIYNERGVVYRDSFYMPEPFKEKGL